MFKKLCAVILSICIAAATVLSINACYSYDNKQDKLAMCIMDEEKELF